MVRPSRLPSAAGRPVVGVTAALLAAAAALVVAGCRSDGRELREPRPDQTASVSTAPTTSVGAEFGLPDLDDATSLPTTAPALPGGVGEVVAPWRSGAPIDPRNTCDGLNVSPALAWDPAPAGTAEIALSLTDLDMPSFVHWVVAGISPDATGIDEDSTPLGAVAALNSVGDIGYTGPCPPAGEEHSYLLTVHYLGEESGLVDGEPGEQMLARIRQTVIATAEVTGTFSR
ncbi:MAG: YbhB/YbcL family Raf kinase inhibitor-like protein [Ilumatobacteraceae bacterium]